MCALISSTLSAVLLLLLLDIREEAVKDVLKREYPEGIDVIYEVTMTEQPPCEAKTRLSTAFFSSCSPCTVPATPPHN